MRNLILAAGVAALAISVPAAAKPDRDKGERGAKASKVERGGGKGQRVQARGKAQGKVRVAAVQQRGDNKRERKAEARADRRDDRREVRRDRRDDDRRVVVADRRRNDDRRVIRVDRDGDRNRRMARIFGDRVPAAFMHNCPPGLAKKTPRCVPPGQVGRDRDRRDRFGRFDDDDTIIIGQRLPARFSSNVLPLRLRNVYRDNDRFTHRFGNGFVYRVDRDKQLVSALVPLIGAGLGIGMPFPYSGATYQVPNRFQPFFRDRNDDYFRYANGYVYEIDRDTGLIENMTPLLDRGYGIGQMLPASYGVYNVPTQYRPMYYDSPNAYYRYAPGAIYQVDPTTQLITAVASLLAPGLGIGQQLPSAYSAYNVPLGYRDQYYDTPDSWYRYSNGNIYQVDPTTQLITALVRSVV